MIIAGIATQGQTTFDNWTTKYKVEYAGSDLVFQFFPSNSAPEVRKFISSIYPICETKNKLRLVLKWFVLVSFHFEFDIYHEMKKVYSNQLTTYI